MISLPELEQGLVEFVETRTGASASTRVPRDRGELPFVVLSRSGGGDRNLVQSDPTVLFEIWGSREHNPWPLTKQVWELVRRMDEEENLPRGLQVSRVNLSSPVNFPDEATESPRYTFIFNPTLNLN